MNTKYISVRASKLMMAAFMMLLSIGVLQAQDIEGGGTKGIVPGGYGKAEKLYKDLAYHEAIPLYESYLQKHDSASAMAHLGDCYRLTSQYPKAEYWYQKAVDKGGVEPKYKLHLAQMQQVNGKYDEAAKWYAKYKEEVPEDRRSNNEMKACSDYGQYLLSRDRYTVKNLDFNSPGYDFSSALTTEGLVFSSSRDSSKAISREHTWTGTEFFDIYSVKGDKTAFGKPQRLKGDAATKYHEGAVSFTQDYKKVYFTRNNFDNNKVRTSADKIVKLKIYESEVDGKTWKNDKPFAYNNNEYSVGHPALTPDGNTMYFVSDMPGGFGYTDVYVTKKEGESWGTPKNLGPEINTEGREMFPFVDKDGELYFASDGHGGLGGLDNFRVKFNEKTGKAGKIRNIGAPINSSYDDFGMHFGKDKSYGYFTSDRVDGKGLDDIYSFNDDGIYLEGIVVDAKTGEPICNSKVIMNAKVNKAEQGRTNTECDGEFEFNVVRNTDYCFVGSAEGYSTNSDVCATTRGVSPGGKVFVKIPLEKSHEYAMSVTVLGKTPKTPVQKSVDDKSVDTDDKSPKTPEERGLKPLANAKVLISSQCEGWTKAFTADENGKICEVVRCDCDYIIVANATDYLPGSTTVVKDDGECVIDRKCGVNPKEAEVILDLIPNGIDPETGKPYPNGTGIVEEGKEMLLDIYYDFDKWFIRQESERELNRVLGFMQENPDAIVEIGSHTDARAPFDYNIRLSQRRAQSVVDWLIAHGIKKNKLQAKGYGETKTVNGCTDNVTCTEYEHQRNRRTTFRVIGNNINIKSSERFDMQIDPCKVCPF
jgi:outer membrane protein OmpA-like peptidoglycan-associated protein